MKHIVSKLSLACAALLAASLAPAAENLLKNADFGQTVKVKGGVAPLYWNPTGNTPIEVKGADGANYLRIKSGSRRIHLVQSGLKLKSGSEYRFSLRFRGEPGVKGLFYVERHGHVIGRRDFECTGEWQQQQFGFTMPPATNKLPYAVIAVEPGTGTLEAASPELVEIAPRSPENMLRNADFALTENAGGQLRPSFWATNCKAAFEVVKLDDGKNAVRFTLDPEQRGNIIQWGVPLAPGKEYLLSLRYRGTAGAKGMFYAERSGHALGIFKFECGEEWKRGELLVAMPADSGKLPYVVVTAEPGEGNIEVTDLRLRELPPRSADNLLRNGDFSLTASSDGGKKKIPSLWCTTNGADFEIVPGPDGMNAVRFRPDPKSRKHFVQWGVPLAPGKTYLFSVRYRGTPGTSFIYGVERGGKQGFSQVRKDVRCTAEWQTLRHLIAIPETPVPNKTYAVLAPEPGGEYFEIADLRIFPGEAELKNGDFEQGNAEWTLQNAVIADAEGHGRIVRLDGTVDKASIRQNDLLLKRGCHYELSYDARGGDDTKFTDSQNATWYRLALVAEGHPYSTTANWQDSFNRWQHKSIYFTANRNMVVNLVGELRYPGTVHFDNIKLKEVDFIGIPLELVLDSPWNYRRGAKVGTTGTFSGSVFVAAKAEKLRVKFNGDSRELPAEKETRFTFDVPGEPGRYFLEVEALDAEGKVVAAVKDVFTVRGEKPENFSHEVAFDAQHRMYLDGKPFFPLLTWRNRGPLPIEESYPRFVNLGFNMIECPIANIDAADAAGLYVFAEMPGRLYKLRNPEQTREFLADFNKKYGKLVEHPALVGYFSVDEPTWRGDPIEPYAAGYRLLRDEFDPWRPVYINEAPRGSADSLRPVANACDVYGVDIYPIPSPNPHSELDDKFVTSVGKYTDICRDVTRDRKPLWMCLQGFAWGTLTHTEEIYPTYDESRFMAFDAIAHGATGLVYWGLYMGRGENPEFLEGLGKVLGEITSVSAYLVGDTVENGVACDDPAIRVMRKRTAQGDLWIVLNESKDEKRVTLRGELPKKPAETSGLAMPESADGELALTLPAYGVRVFRDAEKPAPEPLHVPKERRPQNVFHGKNGFKRASWVWYPGENKIANSSAYFEQEFTLDAVPKTAELAVACDDMFRCRINGEVVMEQCSWARAYTLDVAKHLKPGKNVIRIHAADAGGPPCGLLYALSFDDGREILSGDGVRVSHDGKNDWIPVQVLGKYGIKPWTEQISAVPYAKPLEDINLKEEE